MTSLIYAASVPVFTRHLTSLLSIMEKAETSAQERKFDVEFVVNDRLAPDMRPFKFQIQSATDHAKFVAARLAGRTPPSWADDEVSFGDLKARVNKALAYLKEFAEAEFADAEQREVTVPLRSGPLTLTGEKYFLNMGLPNFYFHYTTAYAILRKNGVPIGKRDYLG